MHLLGQYHDSVLLRLVYAHGQRSEQASRVRAVCDVPKLSLHARYTAFWREASPSYRRAATLLMVIESTQLLAEMLARRRLGRARAWDAVVAIEVVKVLLRLLLRAASQQRPVVSPPLPQREFDPALLDTQHAVAGTLAWRGRRTGLQRRSLASVGPRDVYEQLLAKTLTEQDVLPPPLLVRPLATSAAQVAETLWIVRPLLYVILLRRYGPRDAKPWGTSLFLELLARLLRRHALVPHGVARGAPPPPPSSISLLLSMLGIENSALDWLASSLSARPKHPALKPVSGVEADEWAARDRSFWWYLLRGPAWYHWTRPRLARFVAGTEHRRIIGLLGSIVGDYLPLIDEYYYYSAV